LPGLEEATRARLLEEEGEHAYAFTHDLIREVVIAGLSSARRTLLHRRVAEALEALPGEPPLEALAYHFTRADASGTPDKPDNAIVYLERAGDRALARFAGAEARSCYRELIARLEAAGRALDAARARDKLCDALLAVEMLGERGRPGAGCEDPERDEEALAALYQALETYRQADDLQGQARVTAQLGRVCARCGRTDEGLTRVRSLLAKMQRADAALPAVARAALYEAEAWLLDAAQRWDEALAACTRAAEYANAAEDARLLTHVEMLRGGALLALGRTEESLVVLRRAAALSASREVRELGGK
jgi:predicted ATPase